MKLLLLIPLLALISCGPSIEEIEAREKAKADSIKKVTQVVQVSVPKIEKYFLASDFALIPGKIVGWAPLDNEIESWRCSGGDNPDGTIYIHIQDETGKVTVMICDYRAWVNLHTGDILK